jgi:hypothetical protein
MREIYNLFLFLAICFVVYILFRSFHLRNFTEGMTNNDSSSSSSGNGVAGGAAAYAASLKASAIKMQDTFLVSKYRADYESAILNLDDLISNMMLNTALSFNPDSPTESIEKLSTMQQAKTALNTVMKFVDTQ